MSIADKLTYLNTTKQLLKTEINKINNVLDDNSTFRSYPQELFNGYLDILNNGTDTLWSNLEKVSQTGAEAVLENVETAPIKMVLNGNTSQDTTSGKNVFDNLNLNEIISKGVTFTPVYKNNQLQYINVNGTSTERIFYNLKKITLPSETYKLSGCKGGSASTYSLTINFIEGTSNRIVQEDEEKTFYLSKEETMVESFIRVESGVEMNNVKFYPMIRKSNIEDDSYEPYTGNQPSPNPDYPQQVKVVKGSNVVSVQGKNVLPLENKDITVSGMRIYTQNGSFYADGTATGNIYVTNSNFKSNFNFTLKKGTYTFSLNVLERHQARIIKSDDNTTLAQVDGFTTTSVSFTLEEDKDVFLGFYFAKDLVLNNLEYKLQLEQGSTATEYQPFSKTDYPIDLTAKNIFDKDNANILNAWINASTKVITASNSNRTIWVEAESNKTYKVKKIADTSSNGRFRVGSSPNVPVGGGTLTQAIQDDNAEEISITTSANDKYIAVFCYNTSSSISLDDILASLEIKEANAVYEEMCKIGDYKDYFHKDSGKWYVHKEIGKKIFDGTENWSASSTQTTGYYRFSNASLQGVILPPSSNDEALLAYFNTFETISANNTYRRHNGISCCTSGNYIDVYYDQLAEGTAEDFKTWLSTHNTIVYYVLATPTEEEITNTTLIEQLEAIYKAKSVKDKTYITQTNEELPFILDVEAIKKYEVA